MSDPIEPPNVDLSDEDQSVWDKYTGKDKIKGVARAQEENFERLLSEEEIFIDDKQEAPSPSERIVTKLKFNKKINNDAVDFQIDRRTAEKLRKGKIPIEGRIDLHGMIQDQAHEALTYFIENSLLNQKRCVLVITGKGKAKSTSEEWLMPGQGVLKRRVPEWLSCPPFNKKILKICEAQPKHGGSGALYVYLRQQIKV